MNNLASGLYFTLLDHFLQLFINHSVLLFNFLLDFYISFNKFGFLLLWKTFDVFEIFLHDFNLILALGSFGYLDQSLSCLSSCNFSLFRFILLIETFMESWFFFLIQHYINRTFGCDIIFVHWQFRWEIFIFGFVTYATIFFCISHRSISWTSMRNLIWIFYVSCREGIKWFEFALKLLLFLSFKYQTLFVKMIWRHLMKRILVLIINCVDFRLILIVCWGFRLNCRYSRLSRSKCPLSCLFYTSNVLICFKNFIITISTTFYDLGSVHISMRWIILVNHCSVSLMIKRRFIYALCWFFHIKIFPVDFFIIDWTSWRHSFIIFFYLMCVYWKIRFLGTFVNFIIVPIFLFSFQLFLLTQLSYKTILCWLFPLF